jgi:hypothetical protein
MIIISHRANLNGPDKQSENNPQQIKKVISEGFNVEIDLWKQDDRIYLGHDSPEILINDSFLFDIPNSLWIHCKNIESAEFCCLNDLTWFGHDVDNYVSIFGKKNIWRHPNSNSKFTKNTIAVLPELSRLSVNDLNSISGICTDYPLIYSHSKLSDIEKIYLPVYELLKYKHKKLLENEGNKFDNLISYNDTRRCLAIWSYLNDSEFNNDFNRLTEEIKTLKLGIIYTAKKSIEFGRLHFTLLQCFGFETNEINEYDIEKNKNNILNLIHCDFTIEWRELVIIQSGVIMLGIPSIDLNNIRNKLVDSFKFKEPYLNNIVHSTVLRFNQKLNQDQLKILELKIENTKNFGKSTIKNFDFGKASWLMNNI